MFCGVNCVTLDTAIVIYPLKY